MLDTIPQLPADPNEAGAELTRLFIERGRWPRYDKPLEEMTPVERAVAREHADAAEVKFGWLAEILRSEMLWTHCKVDNNEHFVYAFRFWPHNDGPDYDRDPNGFVVFSSSEEKWADSVLLLQNSDGTWRTKNLQEMLDYWNNIKL